MAEPHRLSLAWRGLLVLGLLLTAWLAWSPSSGPQGPPHLDKLNHCLAFAALGLATFRAFPRWCRAAALGLLGFGVLIELVQAGLPTRSAEWPDVLADALGIGLGWALSQGWRKITANNHE